MAGGGSRLACWGAAKVPVGGSGPGTWRGGSGGQETAARTRPPPSCSQAAEKSPQQQAEPSLPQLLPGRALKEQVLGGAGGGRNGVASGRGGGRGAPFLWAASSMSGCRVTITTFTISVLPP